MIQFDNAVERFGDIILNELKEKKITAWVAGGIVRDYFLGNKMTSDFDLFFPDEKNFKKAFKHMKKKGGEIVFETENGVKVKYNGRVFDLVKKYFKNPQESIEAFDFTVSMLAVDNEKVYHGPSTFIDLSKKQLMFNKITFPASTLRRSFKYYKKGFTMCAGEMKRLLESIQRMDPPKDDDEGESDENEGTSGDSIWGGID
jgi:tRNA nucleotidyltransferase/poly(A) polymerase